jgi:beta-mannosidase
MSDSVPIFMKNNLPDGKIFAENCHHGEYWWHSYRRDKKIYGEFDSPEEYIPYSQWTQAEGLRYIIETERRMAPYASGSMVWQVNEPWPNVDCTNLVDYFGNPKMAYYWVKGAFSKSDVSLKYTSITFNGRIQATVSLYGDATPCNEKCRVSAYSMDGKELFSEILSTDMLPYELDINAEGENIVFIRLSSRGIIKDYFFSSSKEEHYKAMRGAKETSLALTVSDRGFDGEHSLYTYEVKNVGKAPAFFVNLRDKNLGYAILANDQYFTLLPGEVRKVEITLNKRTGIFFDKPVLSPEIVARALNVR